MSALRRRADTYSKIRSFFRERSVLEVETPLLARATATEPYLRSLSTRDGHYLQTSPEFAMKRLLAAGSGSIYQICKAFREGESGARHNPEFTMLEWYRVGFSLPRLIEEVAELIRQLTGRERVEILTYAELFENHLGINPHTVSTQALAAMAAQRLDYQTADEDRDTLLDLLLSHLIEPQLGREGMTFVCEYPASQCALARLKTTENGRVVAERFELYLEGMELANGYHELTDPQEQQRRFASDIDARARLGLPPVRPSELLIGALQAGLPDCCGVALGLDRLLMVILNEPQIGSTLSFAFDRV